MLPAWASGISGLARTTEPTQTEKNLGWQANQIPPSTYFNWAMNLYYQWIDYLRSGIVDGFKVEGVGAYTTPAAATGHSFALGNIYKDSLISAWGFFGITGSSNVPAMQKSFNFVDATRIGLGNYRAKFLNQPSNNLYCALAGTWGGSPGGTGTSQGYNVLVSNTTTDYVEIKTYSAAQTVQDPVSGFFVVAIGAV